MAVIVSEMYGRQIQLNEAERVYLVMGTTDEAEARAAAMTDPGTPGLINGLPITDGQAKEIEGVAGGAYVVTVKYGNPNANPAAKETGDSTFTFDTTGGKFKISQVKPGNHIGSYDSTGAITTAQDGALNVNNGKVEGLEVGVRAWKFSETHYIADSAITDAYKLVLYNLTWCYNNATFRDMPAGECLFMGVRGSKRGKGDWELNFDFAGSGNQSGLVFGDITVPTVLGWDYLWFEYEPHADATTKTLVMKPKRAHVDRIYDPGDFSGLAIG